MKHKGLMFFIMYFCAVFCSVTQLKIVPLLGILGQNLMLDMGQVSWLMSVFTVAGIVLAIPAGGLVGKFGPKKVFAAVMVITIIGNIIGVFGLDNYGVLLFSRIFEGCGFAMASIAGIVFCQMWFPNKNTGLFIGIFVTFAAIASVLTLNVALPISQMWGLASVWWLTAFVSACLTVLFVMFVKEAPAPDPAPAPEGAPEGEAGSAAPEPAPAGPPMGKPSLASVITSPSVMLVCGAQLAIGFYLYFFMTNYPTVFGQLYNMDPGTANFYGGLNGLWGIPGCVFGGFLLDKLGKRGTPMLDVVCFAVMLIAAWILTTLNPSLYILHTILTAVFPGLVLTAGNFLVPQCVAKPADIGYGIGVLGLFYNIGIFIGNPIILYGVQMSGSWSTASMILSGVCAAGIVFMLIFMAINNKKKEQANG